MQGGNVDRQGWIERSDLGANPARSLAGWQRTPDDDYGGFAPIAASGPIAGKIAPQPVIFWDFLLGEAAVFYVSGDSDDSAPALRGS